MTFTKGLAFALATLAGAALVSPAFADCGSMPKTANGNTTSNVDPATEKAATPGSRPSTPGTVGAMDNAGGGSFTAGHTPAQTEAENAKAKGC